MYSLNYVLNRFRHKYKIFSISMPYFGCFYSFHSKAFVSLAAASGLVVSGKINRDQLPNDVQATKVLQNVDHQEKVVRARKAVQRHMLWAITGAPGLSVGVSKNGRTIWREGFGLANVETGEPCTGDSVMRIASISKPITGAIAARLVERGTLGLDKSIHDYLSPDEFPQKRVNGKQVAITARQLLSHTAGVRHYPKKDESAPDSTDPVEFMSNRRFSSVRESLSIFKDDPLLSEPGTEFHYTTHGFSLLSAVLEKADGRAFGDLVAELFDRLQMHQSHLDNANERPVAHRTSYYTWDGNKAHRLENVREVDCSNKTAGGGLLSSVGDLLKFANAILYSYQHTPDKCPDGPCPLLRASTVRELWTQHAQATVNGKHAYDYGLVEGWTMPKANKWDSQKLEEAQGECPIFENRKYWYHSGGAVGTSSILLIKPRDRPAPDRPAPQGICVAILVNCQNCSCSELAKELVEIFEQD